MESKSMTSYLMIIIFDEKFMFRFEEKKYRLPNPYQDKFYKKFNS